MANRGWCEEKRNKRKIVVHSIITRNVPVCELFVCLFVVRCQDWRYPQFTSFLLINFLLHMKNRISRDTQRPSRQKIHPDTIHSLSRFYRSQTRWVYFRFFLWNVAILRLTDFPERKMPACLAIEKCSCVHSCSVHWLAAPTGEYTYHFHISFLTGWRVRFDQWLLYFVVVLLWEK